MKKISVIIPVYNTAKYLEQCLESVINQTYGKLEIICVDDCSNDNSYNVISKYAQKDNRIIAKKFDENKGVSAARNYGLSLAGGDYIYFLDSDDWIENNYLENLISKAIEEKADIVINRNLISYKNETYYPYNFQKGQLDIPDNTYINPQEQAHNVFCGPCAKLYRHDLIKENVIKFPEGFIYEDMFFHYAVFAYAKNIYFYCGSEYYYRDTENSITSKIKCDSDKIIKVFELIYDFYKERNLLDKNIKIYYTMPFFNIQNEETYIAFKNYFTKAGEYILNNEIFNDMDKFLCKNIIGTDNYEDYISKFSPNVAISYIRRKK